MTRGRSNNGTASGDSGLKSAGSPPLAVRMCVPGREGVSERLQSGQVGQYADLVHDLGGAVRVSFVEGP